MISEKRWILDKCWGVDLKLACLDHFYTLQHKHFVFFENCLRRINYQDNASEEFNLPKVPWIAEVIPTDVIYKKAGMQKNVRG